MVWLDRISAAKYAKMIWMRARVHVLCTEDRKHIWRLPCNQLGGIAYTVYDEAEKILAQSNEMMMVILLSIPGSQDKESGTSRQNLPGQVAGLFDLLGKYNTLFK